MSSSAAAQTATRSQTGHPRRSHLESRAESKHGLIPPAGPDRASYQSCPPPGHSKLPRPAGEMPRLQASEAPWCWPQGRERGGGGGAGRDPAGLGGSPGRGGP
jgi:hypothetical protein